MTDARTPTVVSGAINNTCFSAPSSRLFAAVRHKRSAGFGAEKALRRCFSVDHMADCASVLDGRGGETETSPRRLRVFMNLNIFWCGVISRRGHMQTFSLEFKTRGPVCLDQKNAGILQI